MAELLKELRSVDFVNYVGVEDFSDKLSFISTTALLVAFAAITSLRTYFLQPLSCYIPSSFGPSVDSEYDYVNNYCWTEGTYAVPVSEFKLDSSADDGGTGMYSDRKIVYYQWVPFVLGLQAVLFYLPRLLWHIVSFDRAGTDVGHIMKVASDAATDDGEKHDKLVAHACRMISQLLEGNSSKGLAAKCELQQSKQRVTKARDQSKVKLAWARLKQLLAVILPSRFTGNWLIITYFFIKIIYFANIITQLVVMQKFLNLDKPRYDFMGINLLWDIVKGKDWEQTMTFPRVGSCAVYLRTASGGDWQFSQCTLPVNMINEKLFIFLWFWFLFVAIATAVSGVVWTLRVTRASLSNKFVKRLFKLADNYQQIRKDKNVKQFSNQFLKRDGTFILKMIALNCGDIICSEIIQELWRIYKSRLKGEAVSGNSAALLCLDGCEDFDSQKPHVRRNSLFQRAWRRAKRGTNSNLDLTNETQVQPTAPPILEENGSDSGSCDKRKDQEFDSDCEANHHHKQRKSNKKSSAGMGAKTLFC